MSPRHVIELADGPGVVDLDGVGHGPIELDGGMMLAALTRVGVGSRIHDQAIAARDAFRAAIADAIDPDALDWFHAAQLVKLVAYAASGKRPHWRARADPLLAEARRTVARRQAART